MLQQDFTVSQCAGNLSDCPGKWNAVPVGNSSVSCSGHGVAVPAVGVCLCWAGYAGTACSDCAPGFQAAAGLCQRAAGSFAAADPHTAAPSGAPPPNVTSVSTAAAVVSVNGTGAGPQAAGAAVPVAGSTLSQRAQQTGSPPPPSRAPADKGDSFRVRLAVGIAIAAATALIALAAVVFYRRRRRRGAADAGKAGLRQFAVGAPPASLPKALPQEVGENTWLPLSTNM